MRADRRLCLDRSLSRLVEESDPEAAIMVAPKGEEVPPDLVTRLDLQVWSDGRVMQGPEPMVAKDSGINVVDGGDGTAEGAPLEGIVHPAGAMPEPARRRRRRAE